MVEGGELGNRTRRGLVNSQELIGFHVLEYLNDSAGPANFDARNGGFLAEAEVYALVAGRLIAAGGRDGGILRSSVRRQSNRSADWVSIAFVSDEVQQEAVILRRCLVVQHKRGAVVGGDDGIHAAIVLQISDGQAASYPGLLEYVTGFPGHIDKSFACVVHQQHGLTIMKIGIIDLDGV